jgi:hypothetical protein
MEESRGPISIEQIAKARQFLDELAPQRACPVCGNKEWVIIDELPTLLTTRAGSIDLGKTIPLIAAICTKCTHLQLFSALLMGIITPSRPELPSQPEVKANG